MHSVTLPDGTRHRDSILKWARVGAYLLMGAAGVLSLLSNTLLGELGPVGLMMGIFLAMGGTLSFLGSLFERWVGEFTGLPLLASSFGVFAVLTTFYSRETPYIAAANMCLLSAVCLGIIARFREVKAVYRLSDHLAKKGQGR